ncbi:hypothetical protein Tco_1127221 [Tanacetum coccineum]
MTSVMQNIKWVLFSNGQKESFGSREDPLDTIFYLNCPIENNSLSGNPTPSSDSVVESLSPLPTPFGDSDSLLEETNTLLSHSNDSLPDYETFFFDIKEKSSGSTTSHFDHSLSDYEAFCFDDDHIKKKSSGSTTSHSDLSLPKFESFHFDLSIDRFLLSIGVILSMRSSSMNSLTSYLHRRVQSRRFHILLLDGFSTTSFVSESLLLTDPSEIKTNLSFPSGNKDKIPSGESKVRIEVMSVLWGKRLPILDGSLLLSRTPDVVFKKVEGIPEVEIRLLARLVRTPDVSVV